MLKLPDPDDYDALPADALDRAQRLLDLAPFIGVDLDTLALVGRHLCQVEREYDIASDAATKAELERFMEEDIVSLAEAIKAMKRAADRGGEA